MISLEDQERQRIRNVEEKRLAARAKLFKEMEMMNNMPDDTVKDDTRKEKKKPVYFTFVALLNYSLMSIFRTNISIFPVTILLLSF